MISRGIETIVNDVYFIQLSDLHELTQKLLVLIR